VALQRQGVPKSKTELISFTEIIDRALDEQFVEPLFADEGNIRRYSYDYVAKVHQLRINAIQYMRQRARDVDKIEKKINTVYNAILSESHDFKYENDEALATDFLLQEKYRDVKTKMIDEIDALHQKRLKLPELNQEVSKVIENGKAEFEKWVETESK
jgi:hypothetical protein